MQAFQDNTLINITPSVCCVGQAIYTHNIICDFYSSVESFYDLCISKNCIDSQNKFIKKLKRRDFQSYNHLICTRLFLQIYFSIKTSFFPLIIFIQKSLHPVIFWLKSICPIIIIIEKLMDIFAPHNKVMRKCTLLLNPRHLSGLATIYKSQLTLYIYIYITIDGMFVLARPVSRVGFMPGFRAVSGGPPSRRFQARFHAPL